MASSAVSMGLNGFPGNKSLSVSSSASGVMPVSQGVNNPAAPVLLLQNGQLIMVPPQQQPTNDASGQTENKTGVRANPGIPQGTGFASNPIPAPPQAANMPAGPGSVPGPVVGNQPLAGQQVVLGPNGVPILVPNAQQNLGGGAPVFSQSQGNPSVSGAAQASEVPGAPVPPTNQNAFGVNATLALPNRVLLLSDGRVSR